MPDENTEKLLFEVILDIPQVKEKAEVAYTALARLRKEKAATEADFKSGTIGANEYGKSMLAIDRAIAKTSAELKSYNKILENNEKVNNSAKGSIEQMRAMLLLLQGQYDKLSDAEKKNEAVGGQLLTQIQDLTETLLEQEKASGRAQRQVGFYEKGLDSSRKGVVEYVKEMNVMGISVGDTHEKFKNGSQGVLAFGKAILSARGAAIALTAVPLVLVLTAIIAFLTKSKDGMEFFQRKLAGITAVLDVFTQKFASVGRFIIDAFERPGEAIQKLGEMIKENLTNRLTAFKIILDAIRTTDLTQLANGLIQLFTGVTNASGKIAAATKEAREAAAAGEALARQAQKIADAERKLNVERANSRAKIEELKLLGDDVSKSNEVRAKATQDAFNIEQNLLNRQLDLQKQRVANIRAEIKLRGESKDGLDELAEAESRLGELKEESATRRTELNNKLNQLEIEGQQQVINAQLAQLNEGLRITKERGFQTLEIEKQILAKQLQLDLVGVVKGSEQEKALRLKYKSDLATLILNDLIAQNEQQNRIEQNQLQARLDLVDKGTRQELALQREAVKLREFQEEATARLTIKNAQELEAALTAIHAKASADRKEIDKQELLLAAKAQQDKAETALARSKAGTRAELNARIAQIKAAAQQEVIQAEGNAEAIEAIYAKMNRAIADAQQEFSRQRAQMIIDDASQIVDGLDKLVQAQNQRQQQLLDSQQQAALKSAGLSAEARTKIEEKFAARKEKLDHDAAERQRKIATAQNLISIARGITEAQVLPPPFDIIKTALVIATGAAQQAVIASQQFEYGGEIVNGPSHARGGVKYRVGRSGRIVELEGDEGVINKRSMAIPGVREQASYLNQLGGGVAYPGTKRIALAQPAYQYTSTRMEYGGVTSPMYQSVQATIDYSQLGQVVSGMVVSAVKSLPPSIVRVTDIQDRAGRRSRVERRADVMI